jgi:DNA-binding winged helix-turn-helix (wHTH) protein
VLLVSKAGALVTRDEIREALWRDGTYVDFDQAVNFSIRQVREVLGDSAERPLFIETVPRRGYRFIAPVQSGEQRAEEGATVRLQKALWQNVAELRLAEVRRQRYDACRRPRCPWRGDRRSCLVLAVRPAPAGGVRGAWP